MPVSGADVSDFANTTSGAAISVNARYGISGAGVRNKELDINDYQWLIVTETNLTITTELDVQLITEDSEF